MYGSIRTPTDDAKHQSPFEAAVKAGQNPIAIKTLSDLDNLSEMIFYDPPWIPDMFKRVIVNRAKRKHAHYQHVLSEIMRSAAIWRDSGLIYERLSTLATPTLIIWGDQDQILDKSSSEIFLEHIPNAQLSMLSDTGHVPMIEKPSETAKILSNFLVNL